MNALLFGCINVRSWKITVNIQFFMKIPKKKIRPVLIRTNVWSMLLPMDLLINADKIDVQARVWGTDLNF